MFWKIRTFKDPSFLAPINRLHVCQRTLPACSIPMRFQERSDCACRVSPIQIEQWMKKRYKFWHSHSIECWPDSHTPVFGPCPKCLRRRHTSVFHADCFLHKQFTTSEIFCTNNSQRLKFSAQTIHTVWKASYSVQYAAMHGWWDCQDPKWVPALHFVYVFSVRYFYWFKMIRTLTNIHPT
jgi:hypothetical protein